MKKILPSICLVGCGVCLLLGLIQAILEERDFLALAAGLVFLFLAEMTRKEENAENTTAPGR